MCQAFSQQNHQHGTHSNCLGMELLQPVTMHWEDCIQEKICTCRQVLQGGKWAEEFSHFSLLAPQKSWLFLEYVHVPLHNSASHSICNAQTESVILLSYSGAQFTSHPPKTKESAISKKIFSACWTQNQSASHLFENSRERWTCTSRKCGWLHQMQVSPHWELIWNHPWSLWCSPHLLALKGLQDSLAWSNQKPVTGLSRTETNHEYKRVCNSWLLL